MAAADERRQLVLELLRLGRTRAEVAEQLGITSERVSAIARAALRQPVEAAYALRPEPPSYYKRRKARAHAARLEMVGKLMARGCTLAEIAALLRISVLRATTLAQEAAAPQ